MHERKHTILAVDDSDIQLLVIKKTLNEYNCFVEVNPERVIARLEEVSPDLLILDVNMPGTSGLEIAEKVKQHPRFSHLPIMFLSSEVDVVRVVACIKIGAIDFVRKPFIPEELQARVATQIKISEMNKALTEKREIEAIRKLMVSINHIFNNKLAIVLLNTEMLKEVHEEPETRKMVQRIETACNVQLKVIEKLNTLKHVAAEQYCVNVDMLKIDLEGMENL
jgi:PleD family two-component response regulator